MDWDHNRTFHCDSSTCFASLKNYPSKENENQSLKTMTHLIYPTIIWSYASWRGAELNSIYQLNKFIETNVGHLNAQLCMLCLVNWQWFGTLKESQTQNSFNIWNLTKRKLSSATLRQKLFKPICLGIFQAQNKWLKR